MRNFVSCSCGCGLCKFGLESLEARHEEKTINNADKNTSITMYVSLFWSLPAVAVMFS